MFDMSFNAIVMYVCTCVCALVTKSARGARCLRCGRTLGRRAFHVGSFKRFEDCCAMSRGIDLFIQSESGTSMKIAFFVLFCRFVIKTVRNIEITSMD